MNEESKLIDLERRITLLENYVNLLSMRVTNFQTEDSQKRKSQYKKYVVVTDDIEGVIFSLNNENDHPNVSYVRIDGVNNIDIVVISKDFFVEWKRSHYRFLQCSYEQLVNNLRKDGVIN